jgi:hypothetical protein
LGRRMASAGTAQHVLPYMEVSSVASPEGRATMTCNGGFDK